jgi:hypothetical protein
MIAFVFLLDEQEVRTRPEMVLSESVGTKRMRANTQFCGIFTFAVLSHLRVVWDERKHLGENHQKLVIPAALFERRHSPGLWFKSRLNDLFRAD